MHPPVPQSGPIRGFARGAAAALALLFALVGCGGGGSGGGAGQSTADGTNTPAPPPAPEPPPSPSPAPEPVPEPTPTARPVILGAQTHFAQNWPIAVADRVAGAGLSQVRDELYWDQVEPLPGTYRFPPAYDAYLAALARNAISPLIELDFANHNYDGGDTPYTDGGIAAFSRYATTVLDHYGPAVPAVEVWNEYNGSFSQGPATADRAGNYFRLLRATFTAVKARRPDVLVAGGATAGLPLPYLEKLFAAGALDSLDAVSVHPYRTDTAPEGLEVQIAALNQLIGRYAHGTAKPVWVTEIGWGTHASVAPGDLAIDEAVQARFLVRACALLASAGVERVYWYLFRDNSETPTMGLVKNDADLTPKLAERAMAALALQLKDARFAAREPAGDEVYSLRFVSAAGTPRRILWALSPFTLAVPAATGVTDIYGAAVNHAAGTITVGDSPVYISGPLPGLPGAGLTSTRTAVTDAESAFSSTQGGGGWSYGLFLGSADVFTPLKIFRTTDWKGEWTDAYVALSITDVDQHPGKSGLVPVAAVRRWVCDFAGTVRATGRFQVGVRGDGVRARVLINGRVAYTAVLSTRTSILGAFDLTRDVQPGTTFDFAVDPGPANNLDYDATRTSVTIVRTKP